MHFALLSVDKIIKSGKTCKEIAPKLRQKLNEDSDPALKEYARLKNMYKSRTERFENRTDLRRKRMANDLTYDEFYLWSANAATGRRWYVAGDITGEEFLRKIKIPSSNAKEQMFEIN